MSSHHKLSAIQCDKAKLKDKPYKLYDGNGLYLEITPKGGRYWRYRYKIQGKEKKLAIGTYPMGLKEARERHKIYWQQVKDGIDPSAKRKEQKQLARKCPSDTFKEFALEWHSKKAPGWCERHAQNILARLQNDIFPEFGDIAIDKILPSHVIEAIEKITIGRGKLDIARRTLNYCVQVFNYAEHKNKITFNPARNRTDIIPARQVNHFATIKQEELPDLLAKLDHYESPLLPQTRMATKLLMLTFVRTKELTDAAWSEFDLDNKLWIIPAERMKKRRDHIVPLATQAVTILKRLKELAGNSPLVFPSRSYLHKPMSNATILNGLKRMGYRKKMTGHGFRSLAATTLREKLRLPRDVIDLQLAHKPIDKSNPYDRSQFIEDRIEMMQTWADYIDRVNPLLSGDGQS